MITGRLQILQCFTEGLIGKHAVRTATPWARVQWSGVDDQITTRHIAIVGPRRGRDGRTETCYTRACVLAIMQ